MFIPNSIYYEKDALNYPLGKELFNKYNEKKIEFVEIENHNNIEELRTKENKEFANLKRNLIIGIRKTHKFVPNYKV